MKEVATITALANLSLLLTIGQAQALMLRLTDVGTGDTETILGVGGQVNFNDDLGDWGLNISVGLSKNVSGTVSSPIGDTG